MKTGIEANRALRYKLHLMGIPINGPMYVYCNNISVVYNKSLPASLLKKKSKTIAYHAVREAAAMKEVVVTHISTDENVLDLMTNVLPRKD